MIYSHISSVAESPKLFPLRLSILILIFGFSKRFDNNSTPLRPILLFDKSISST